MLDLQERDDTPEPAVLVAGDEADVRMKMDKPRTPRDMMYFGEIDGRYVFVGKENGQFYVADPKESTTAFWPHFGSYKDLRDWLDDQRGQRFQVMLLPSQAGRVSVETVRWSNVKQNFVRLDGSTVHEVYVFDGELAQRLNDIAHRYQHAQAELRRVHDEWLNARCEARHMRRAQQ